MNDENVLEDILKKHFQKKIQLFINEEELKSGVFLLYTLLTYSNNYFLELSIKRDKKVDYVKIPYPFSIEEYESEGLLYFDYRVNALCKNNKSAAEKLIRVSNQLPSHKDNKFFNRILEIKFSS